MQIALRFSIVFAIAAMAACVLQPRQTATQQTVQFILVRHTEKANDHSKDPQLSETGIRSAHRLAERLRTIPLTAVYASEYRRTQQTAAIVAATQGLDVVTYNAAQPETDFVMRLLHAHQHGHVLIVGHSNTVPAMATSLCACKVEAIRDDEFDRIITIIIDGNQRMVRQETF